MQVKKILRHPKSNHCDQKLNIYFSVIPVQR